MIGDPDHPVWDLAWGFLIVIGMAIYLLITVDNFDHDEFYKLAVLSAGIFGAMTGRRMLRKRYYANGGTCRHCKAD